MLEGALGFAPQGVPVFPCLARDKRPATTHGFKDATTDLEKIHAWFDYLDEDGHTYNLAVPTGMAFDVIDVDGFEGMVAIEEWAGTKLDVVRYIEPTVLTPSGGYHIYVPCSGIGNKVSWIKHCDYRGFGGYVVVPPSVTEKGRYRWA